MAGSDLIVGPDSVRHHLHQWRTNGRPAKKKSTNTGMDRGRLDVIRCDRGHGRVGRGETVRVANEPGTSLVHPANQYLTP